MTDLLRRNLPKWPQMLVVGERVGVERAKEVIRRTDRFFAYPDCLGGDSDYRKWVIDVLRIPPVGRGEDLDAWRSAWGFIDTEYVQNDWIVCPYIHGPYGWMNPDGSILHIDNIGKWPAGRDVWVDWKVLAAAFPFVKLDAVLMDGEWGYEGLEGVIGFHVEGGRVEVFDPMVERGLVGRMEEAGRVEVCDRPILPGARGVPDGWIKEWGRME